MIGTNRVVAVITARGGSKGLPGKNVRPFAGRPLIAWTVAAARGSQFIDRVVVSSDDEAIIAAARAAGAEAPFRRPPPLATDTATSADVLIHALDALTENDGLVVLLQPTSPLRTAADIDACLTVVADGAPACITVAPAPKPPQWLYYRAEDGSLSPVLPSPDPAPDEATRRQDFPPAYVINGAVYVARIGWFRRRKGFIGDGTRSVVMPAERSVDIDTAADFALAEILAASR